MGIGFVVYCLVVAFFLGAALASFTDCLAYRLLAGESVLRGRSHCDNCGHTLGAADLVPVLSYLFLRGKCRYCGTRVPPESFFCELLSGLVFAALLYRFGLSFLTLRYMLFTMVLLGLSIVDMKSYTIPDRFILVAIGIFLVTVPLVSLSANGYAFSISGQTFAPDNMPLLLQRGCRKLLPELLTGLAGGFLLGGGILLLTLLFDKLTGKEGMGGGDIKLYFAAGLFVKPGCCLLLLLLSCILGLIFTVLLRKRKIPFGPSIAAAVVITLFVGPEIMQWYLGLL